MGRIYTLPILPQVGLVSGKNPNINVLEIQQFCLLDMFMRSFFSNSLFDVFSVNNKRSKFF